MPKQPLKQGLCSAYTCLHRLVYFLLNMLQCVTQHTAQIIIVHVAVHRLECLVGRNANVVTVTTVRLLPGGPHPAHLLLTPLDSLLLHSKLLMGRVLLRPRLVPLQ